MVKKTRKSLIHLKSSVSGKIPTAEQLNYGEIAINYAKDSEAIFFKNSENNVVEVKTNSAVVEELNTKQDKTDNELATTAKTVTGAINEINTKVSNLTGALTWKGKLDTLPAVTDYEAGNVVGVGNKEYVLTVTGSTKAWEELGDESSYLLKSVAEETYLKKAAGEVKSTNLANNAVTKEKLSTDVQSSLDKANNSLQKGNVAAPTSDTDAVNKSYVDGKIENLITNDDSLNLNVPIIIYTSTDDDSIAANKASILFYLNFWEKYTSRITDTTFGDTNIHRPSNICFIPTILSVSKSNNNALGTGIIFGISGVPDISYYHGIFRATSMSDSTHDGSYKIVSINANTGKLESASQLISANISYSKFNTTAKDIFGAINEVNTLAKSKGNGTITEVRMNGVSKGTSGVVDLGTVLTEHQSLKTINGETITGSGDISVKGDTVKCRIDQSTMVSGGDGTQENPYVFKMSLEDVKKYKDCDFVEIYDSSSNTSVYSFYRTLTGIFYTPFIPDVSAGCLAGAFIGNETSTAEQIGFAFYSLHISDEVESGDTALVSSRAVYYALQAKQDKLTSGTNIKTINNQSILGSGNVDISAPIYVVPMIMSTDGYPIPDSSKIDTNKLSVYMKSGYTVIGKPVDSSAPIVSFITGNNGYHYHYFDEKKGMMVVRVYGNNLSQHEIEYNYQFAAPQDSGSTGVCGGVPVPTYDDKEKFLKGDGTWSEVKTIDGESLIGSGDIKIKNNDYYLPVSAFSGQTAVTQDVLDAIVDVRNSQGRKHLYIYDESKKKGAVAEASVANYAGEWRYFVSWMAHYGFARNTIWVYLIEPSTKAVTDQSFSLEKFIGATTSASGREGIIPAPTTADTKSFLCGNGKWEKISGGSSAPSITIDTSMSDTSTNPVQNKVIKAYIDELVGNLTAQLAQI